MIKFTLGGGHRVRCGTVALFFLIAGGLPAVAQTVWEAESISAAQSLTSVTYGAGRFVASGDEGAMAHSVDGESWAVNLAVAADVVQGVSYGCGEFVAVGADGLVLRSADGITWAPETSGTTRFLSGAANGAGRWVAVGGATQGDLESAIVTSTSAGSWTPSVAGVDSFFSDVAYGGGLFVAVGLGGTIITSPDGITWTQQTSETTRYLSGVGYFDGQFVAVGQRGTVLVSSDGSSWTRHSIGFGYWLFDVGKTGPIFTVVGEKVGMAGADPAALFNSTDLTTWTQIAPATTRDLFGIARGSSDLVAVGGVDGVPAVVRSDSPVLPLDPFESWQLANFSAAELADLAISGPSADPDCDDLPNVVEWSHDLDPAVHDSLSLWTFGSTESGGMTFKTIDYIQDLLRPLSVSVSVSTDLSVWTPSGLASVIVIAGATTDTLRFTDTVPVSAGPRKFYKLDFAVE